MKIALGGALYSMGGHVANEAQAKEFAVKMAAAAADLGLDGMDLDVEDSGSGADVQVMILSTVDRTLRNTARLL